MVPKHILIIDDEEDIREVAQLSLEMTANWQVSLASSGAEGIDKAKSELPDAILLDVMMPEMDGIATFEKIQAEPALQNLPVILLTAKIQKTDQQKFAQMGVKGYISKPFDPLTLADKVAEKLDWK